MYFVVILVIKQHVLKVVISGCLSWQIIACTRMRCVIGQFYCSSSIAAFKTINRKQWPLQQLKLFCLSSKRFVAQEFLWYFLMMIIMMIKCKSETHGASWKTAGCIATNSILKMDIMIGLHPPLVYRKQLGSVFLLPPAQHTIQYNTIQYNTI